MYAANHPVKEPSYLLFNQLPSDSQVALLYIASSLYPTYNEDAIKDFLGLLLFRLI